MTNAVDQRDADALAWLLEPDPSNPSIRYFALTNLLARPPDDPAVCKARAAIMATGPVPAILDAQYPEGFWVKAGGGYSPKYRSTVWQIMFLAELGADPTDERVRRGCAYVLDHTLAASGAFAAGSKPSPSGAIHCLNGNLIHALIRLGWLEDTRVQGAIAWLARSIVGDDDLRYYKWGTCGPGFACGINDSQPCAWGANKALKALLAIPRDRRGPEVREALAAGAEFLLSRDPARADYPYSGKVSAAWFKLGFPLTYWSDVLETAQVLVDLGFGADQRLQNVVQWLRSQQDAAGRWPNRNKLSGKLWFEVEQKGRASKWITLRALRLLRGPGRSSEHG